MRKYFAAAAVLLGGVYACANDSKAATATEEIDPSNVTLTTYVNDAQVGSCSGVLLAPHVVLTAAHCVAGKTAAFVKAPYAKMHGGVQVSWSTLAHSNDWDDTPANNANGVHHDVALVFISSPIQIKHYPDFSSLPVRDGAGVTIVRRGFKKKDKHTKLFLGFSTPAASGTKNHLPNHYATTHKARMLDTGGAVFSSTGKIVGIVAGKGSNTGKTYVSRIDGIASWLRGEVTTLPGDLELAPSAVDNRNDSPKSGAADGGEAGADAGKASSSSSSSGSSGSGGSSAPATTAPATKPPTPASGSSMSKPTGGSGSSGGGKPSGSGAGSSSSGRGAGSASNCGCPASSSASGRGSGSASGSGSGSSGSPSSSASSTDSASASDTDTDVPTAETDSTASGSASDTDTDVPSATDTDSASTDTDTDTAETDPGSTSDAGTGVEDTGTDDGGDFGDNTSTGGDYGSDGVADDGEGGGDWADDGTGGGGDFGDDTGGGDFGGDDEF